MLRISPETQDAFVSQAMPAFRERVRAALAQKYPHFLPRFPAPVQARIVGNMIGRAQVWGLSWQSSLLAFCEFMIGVAGNFDEQPQITAALQAVQTRGEQILGQMPFLLPHEAWTQAGAGASMLPFFIAPDLIRSPHPTQVAAAIAFVLFDRLPEGSMAPAEAEAGLALAQRLGIDRHPDAGLVLGVCLILYGPDFPDRLAWTKPLVQLGAAPAVVGALRQRVAQDHAKLV